MRIRWSTVVVLIACGALLMWRHAPRGRSSDPDDGNQRVFALLDRRVHLPLEDVPLEEALAQLADRAEVTVRVDPLIAGSKQQELRRPVSLPDFELRVESALQLLLRQADKSQDLAIAVKDGDLLITTNAALVQSTRLHVGQVHPIPVGALGERGIDSENLVDVIESALSPAAWEDVGGSGAIRELPGAVAVSQPVLLQRQIERLIEALVDAERYPEQTSPIRIVPSRSDAFIRWQQALNAPVTVNIDDGTFGEIMQMLRERYGLPLYFDRAALDEIGFQLSDPEARLSLPLRDVRLATVLHWVTEQFGLVAIDLHDTVFITTPEITSMQTETIVYPVDDLVQPHDDFDTLIDAMLATVRPDTWYHVGGDGDIQRCGRALVVTQSAEGHAQIADFLRRLRQVVVGAPSQADEVQSIGAAKVRAQLKQTVSLDVHNQPLNQVIDQLCEANGLNFVVDNDALDESGAWDAWQSPVSLQVSDRPLSDVFRELLSDRRLIIHPWEDILLISTVDARCANVSVEFYDIAPLISPNERGYFHAHHASVDDVRDLITSVVAPNSWDDVGGEGSLTVVHNVLIVFQTEGAHASIRHLLDDLMRIPDLPDEFAVCSTLPPTSSEDPCAWNSEEPALTTRIYQLGPAGANLARPPLANPWRDPQLWESGPPSLALVAFITTQSQTASRLGAETDDEDSMPVTWDYDGRHGVVQELVVEDRPVVVVRQNIVGHERVARMLEAVVASRSNPSRRRHDESGWHELPLPGRDAAERTLLARDVARELDWLWQLEANEVRNPFLSSGPTTLLWQFLISNLPDEDQRKRTYVWHKEILTTVDDPVQADSARQGIDALLATFDQVHAEMVAGRDAPLTLSQQTDRLLDILLADHDAVRRQSAMLLLGAHAASARPLTAEQAGRLAQWSADVGRPLEWQVFLMAVRASGPHGVALLESIERMLPNLSPAQTVEALNLLGTLGPQAVPLLCRIPVADRQQRALLHSNLKLAANGDAKAIADIIHLLTESDHFDLDEMMYLLGTIDPNFVTTRMVLRGAPPEPNTAGAHRWLTLRNRVETQTGDPFP